MYKSVLQEAANGSITIASIGELTNLQDLLRDDRELVRQKVKRVVYMDGNFNFGCADGAYGPNYEFGKVPSTLSKTCLLLTSNKFSNSTAITIMVGGSGKMESAEWTIKTRSR